jgi:serine/threonine-protein kinase PknK
MHDRHLLLILLALHAHPCCSHSSPLSVYVLGGAADEGGDTILSGVARFDGTTWTDAIPMNVQRMMLGAAVLGPYLFATGGWDGYQALASGERFDGSAWVPIADMIFPRYGHALASMGDTLYAIGGFDSAGSGAMSSTDAYSSSTGTWSAAPSMLQARFGLAAAVFNGSVVAVGGLDENGLALYSIELLTDIWQEGPSMLVPRWGMGLCIVGPNYFTPGLLAVGGDTDDVAMFDGTQWEPIDFNRLPESALGLSAAFLHDEQVLAIGGDLNGTLSRDVLTYNLNTGWITSTPMHVARKWHSTVTYQAPDRSRLYAIGGVQTPNVLDVVEEFDGTVWAVAPSLLQARHNHAAVAYNNTLFVLGGNGNRTILSSVEAFDGVVWSLAPPMSTPRNGLGAAVFQNKLYAVGGNSGVATFLSSVEVFDGSSWAPAPSMATNRTYHGVAVFQGYLYAVGGHNIAITSLTSVERFDGKAWALTVPMPQRRENFGCAVYNGLLFAVGGNDDFSTLRSVSVFDGTEWSSGEALNDFREQLGLAIFQGELIAVGGDDLSYHTENSGERFNGIVWVNLTSMAIPRTGVAAVAF